MFFQPRDTSVIGHKGSPVTGYWPQALPGAPALTGIVPMMNHVQVPFGAVAVNVTFHVRDAGGAMTVGVMRDDGDGPPMTPVPVVADMQQIEVPYHAYG